MPKEPELERVTAMICNLCLDGKGGECHTPGCVFWMADAPTHVLRERLEDQDPKQKTR